MISYVVLLSVAFVLILAMSLTAEPVLAEGGGGLEEIDISTSGGVEPSETTKVEAKKEEKKVKSSKKRSQKDWNKLTAEKLDKEWEEGDDPELVENEFERQQKINREKAGQNMKGFDMNNPKKFAKQMADKKKTSNLFNMMGGSSTKMVFVDLNAAQPDGKPWDKKSTDKLAGKWQSLIKTGSLTANVFNIEDGKLLISVDKSYMFGEIMKFAFNQVETEKISIDGKDYHAKDYKDKDEEDW